MKNYKYYWNKKYKNHIFIPITVIKTLMFSTKFTRIFFYKIKLYKNILKTLNNIYLCYITPVISDLCNRNMIFLYTFITLYKVILKITII